MNPLPPDPYKALGLTKDAKTPEIRTAHRKLVLKCHPDKVQDPDLKAIKQDEFQKVQQAYELLIDDTKRAQYDEQVKLFELRKEMGKGISFSANFSYDIRTAEPRASTFKTKSKEGSKVYSHTPPRSYEDKIYDDAPRATARKSGSYEERRRPGPREEDRRRADDRERWEKENRRASHGERKKTRDKERKKGSEDKYRATQNAFVETDSSSDDYSPRPQRPADKKSTRSTSRIDEEIARLKLEAEKVQRAKESERTAKLNAHMGNAAEYMQAARRKVVMENDFEAPRIQRAATFQEGATYNVRHVVPPNLAPFEDSDVRRSSAPRRASEQLSSPRSRDSPRSAREKKSYEREREPVIPDPPRVPPLQTRSSAPPTVPEISSRKEPIRSKTSQPQYGRKEPPTPPQVQRAATFQVNDRRTPTRGSKLKNPILEDSPSSESDDSPPFVLRPPSPRRRESEATRYKIDTNKRAVPVERHRERDSYSDDDRDESPRGTGRRSAERPAISRNTSSAYPNTRLSSRSGSQAQPQTYYTRGSSPEPVAHPTRPKMPARESRSTATSARQFGEIRYQPARSQDIKYSEHARRASERGGFDNYPPTRPAREFVH
jgi:curved DNA-binding protein CbpA